jgi:predicted transcriptional regulator of viral defense system
MDKTQENKLKKLGIFTLAQANELGITQQRLSKLVKQEKIKRVDRGIFLHPEANLDSEYDFQIACAKLGPDAVIGGLSALFYYNLVDQSPKQTWVLVPPHKITSKRAYRLIRTQTPLDKGVIIGNGFKIASIERAIAESFKLASKIGERTAIKACRIALQQKQTTLKKIGVIAKELGLDSYLTKNFDTIIGAVQRLQNKKEHQKDKKLYIWE